MARLRVYLWDAPVRGISYHARKSTIQIDHLLRDWAGQSHRLAGLRDRLLCNGPRSLRAHTQDVDHLVGMLLKLTAPLADRVQELVQLLCEYLLALHITNGALAISFLKLRDLILIGVEQVVVDEEWVPLHRAWIVGMDALRIGVHAHHFFA